MHISSLGRGSYPAYAPCVRLPFDPNDLDNDSKINTAIKHNFIGETAVPLPEHCRYAKLVDMLDFRRTDFNKVIDPSPKLQLPVPPLEVQQKIVGKYETVDKENYALCSLFATTVIFAKPHLVA